MSHPPAHQCPRSLNGLDGCAACGRTPIFATRNDLETDARRSTGRGFRWFPQSGGETAILAAGLEQTALASKRFASTHCNIDISAAPGGPPRSLRKINAAEPHSHGLSATGSLFIAFVDLRETFAFGEALDLALHAFECFAQPSRFAFDLGLVEVDPAGQGLR